MLSNHPILCHPLLFCLHSFLATRSFSMSHFFTSGIQSIAASVSSSALLMNIKGWFPLGLVGLISLLSKRLLRVFSSTTIWKQNFFGTQPFYDPVLTSVHNYWKNHSVNYKDLLMGPDAMVSAFWMLTYKPMFSLSSFTPIKRFFSSSSLSAIRVVSSAYLRLLIFLLASWFQLVIHLPCHFIYEILLCNIVLYSIRLYYHHWTHPQLSTVSTLAQLLHSFWCGGGLVTKSCPIFVTPWTVSYQATWGFLGKNIGVGFHFPLQWTLFC